VEQNPKVIKPGNLVKAKLEKYASPDKKKPPLKCRMEGSLEPVY
jgi:hypothetical protein